MSSEVEAAHTTAQANPGVWEPQKLCTFSAGACMGVLITRHADMEPAHPEFRCIGARLAGAKDQMHLNYKLLFVIWVDSSVVRAAGCRSAGPWFKARRSRYAKEGVGEAGKVQ